MTENMPMHILRVAVGASNISVMFFDGVTNFDFWFSITTGPILLLIGLLGIAGRFEH